MGRKDRERFLRIKEANPSYQGFRGAATVATPPRPPQPVTESVTCSNCGRRRNVNVDTLPEDRSTYVCLRCQDDLAA
jgi:DNA-directed RNA polymerase subunit RPC12/RpoP